MMTVETSRRSEVKELKTTCDRMFTGVSTSKSSILCEGKGVSRPLYRRLQKHKKRHSQFSNQENKWISPRNGNKAKTSLFYKGNEDKEDKKPYCRTCEEAMNCIACMSRQMQYEIAKMFSPSSENDEWRCRKAGRQSGCTCNNVQLSDVSTINSTDVYVDAAAAEEMPACPVSSERSARHGHTPFTSAPAQLMPRALWKMAFDVSLLEKRDMYASNSYSQYTVPVLKYSSRNCFSQNAIPRVRMARTKQTAPRDRDDRRRDEDRRGDDRRSEEKRGCEPTKSTARRRRRGTPPPEKYVCIFCQKENRQRIYHKRH